MENKPIERWHGAHHYSNRLHLFFVFFLFLASATVVWSYFELNNAKLTSKISPSPTPTTASSTPTPKTTCTPRPSCLDSFPRCMIAETSDMCPPSITPTSNSNQGGKVFCTQEAKQCPDGSWVGRTGPNCEFSPCLP